MRQSEGFNPRPRISLPLPRPVGIASDCERAILELTRAIEPASLSALLVESMPRGIEIGHVRLLKGQGGRHPRLVEYSVGLSGCSREVLTARAARLMRFEPIWYERFVYKKSKEMRVDLRPYVDSIGVVDHELRFALHVTAGGSAKPAEICEVMGLGGDGVNHLICRRKIAWQENLKWKQ